MQFMALPRETLGVMFRIVGPHLLRGLAAAPDQTVQGVIDDILDGTTTLWVAIDEDEVKGVFLTALVDDGGGKSAVDVFGLSGQGLDSWGKDLSDTMAAFAKHNDAHRVIFAGRKGLLKFYSGVRIVGEHSPGVFQFERTVQ